MNYLNCKCNCVEEWVEFNDDKKYQISNKGRVWSCYTNKLRKISIEKNGNYSRSIIYFYDLTTKKRYKKKVHRLVYQHFDDCFRDDLYIDHIDNNTMNNCICNLRIVSHKINMKNLFRNGSIGKRKSGSYRFRFIQKKKLNILKHKSKNFNTEKEAKIYQRWFIMLNRLKIV